MEANSVRHSEAGYISVFFLNEFSVESPAESWQSWYLKWKTCRWTRRSWAACEPLSSSTQVREACPFFILKTLRLVDLLLYHCKFWPHWLDLCVFQMQKVFQTHQKSRGWGKRFTPHWSRTQNRNTQTSLAGGNCSASQHWSVLNTVIRLYTLLESEKFFYITMCCLWNVLRDVKGQDCCGQKSRTAWPHKTATDCYDVISHQV